jgi:hypothetical protein
MGAVIPRAGERYVEARETHVIHVTASTGYGGRPPGTAQATVVAFGGSGHARSLLRYEEREVVLRADFESVDADDCCWVSLHFIRGPRRPRAGEWVYLLDGRGNGCLAVVDQVHGWIARVKPDWGTWGGPIAPRARTASQRRVRGMHQSG